MELPFKKGDVVRFADRESGDNWFLSRNNISTQKAYTVLRCQEHNLCKSGIMVEVVGLDGREWDIEWFVLDKNSIVRSILNDL